MGQELTSMCTCFDSSKEQKEEMSFLKADPEIQIPSINNEVEGFNYSDIQSKFSSVQEDFISLINEGVTNYDTIVDKDNCKVYSREAENGYILKYTWNIAYSPSDFLAFIDKIDLRKSWDTNIEIVKNVAQFSKNESVVYTKYKKFLTFDPRDTLAFSKNIELFGNLAVVSFSLESDKYPIVDNIVRVKLYTAGMYIENIIPDENGNFCRVTCLSHMDVGLPKNLNNIARKFAGTTLPPITKKIVTQLKKYMDEKSGNKIND